MSSAEDYSIRELIAARASAANAADLEAMAEAVADDVVLFGMLGELYIMGKSAVRKGAEA